MASQSLELIFPRSAPPYAEVAAYIHAVRSYNAKNLKLDVAAGKDAKLTLTVPPVAPKNKPSFVAGSGVLRYMSRLSPPSRTLYDENSLAEAALSDALFDRARAILTQQDVTQLAQEINEHKQKFLVVDDKPMLGDLAVWGALRCFKKIFNQLPGTKELHVFTAWLAALDHLAEAKLAVEMVDAVIDAFDNPVDVAAIAASANKVTIVPEIGDGTVSDPRNNPLDVFRNLIAAQIAPMAGVDPALVHGLLEAPRQPENGDFAIAVPRTRVKGNPTELAKEWAERFVANDHIVSATAIGQFINFRLSKQQLNARLLRTIYKQKQDFGSNKLGAGKTVIVEYSSPNIAKPFHVGHLRSTIIGQFIKNVHEANGWKTIGMNYLGDWGKQYGLLAVGFERHGDDAELEKDAIKHLFDVYVKINSDADEDPTIHDLARAYFRKMEDGEPEALALWNRFRDLSIVKYRDTYERLAIKFDVYSGESQVTGGMTRALDMLKKLGLIEESDGALIIDLSKHKLGTAVVQKKDGTTLYITRDIGAAIERYEKYKFDAMYYVVAAQQDLHLKQLFKILGLMGFEWASKCMHINFGLINNMATRKGNVVFLEDILNQTKEVMHDEMRKNETKYAQIKDPEDVADTIGISAVKVQDMAARRIKNYDFDWTRMFSFEGDTGPYLQYAHARMCSIERNCKLDVNPDADLSLLSVSAAQQLLNTIAKYPDVVRNAVISLEPVNIVTYCFELSHTVSLALETLYVLNQDKSIADSRLLMYWAARVTLGNAMRLLGLRPLERM